jgi:hypothetical protein
VLAPPRNRVDRDASQESRPRPLNFPPRCIPHILSRAAAPVPVLDASAGIGRHHEHVAGASGGVDVTAVDDVLRASEVRAVRGVPAQSRKNTQFMKHAGFRQYAASPYRIGARIANAACRLVKMTDDSTLTHC